MAITKSDKQAMITRYEDILRGSKGVVLASFTKLTVKQQEDLRQKVRELGGEFHVVKNTLVKLALQHVGLPVPEEALLGTTVIGTVADDVPGLAKTIVEAAKQSESIRVKAAVIDGVLYGARQVEQLAELPGLPVLRARLLGLIQTPASRVVGALNGSVRQLASVVKAYSETAAPA